MISHIPSYPLKKGHFIYNWWPGPLFLMFGFFGGVGDFVDSNVVDVEGFTGGFGLGGGREPLGRSVNRDKHWIKGEGGSSVISRQLCLVGG